jgi:membrane fusion protein (multidrug efflux system)
METSLGNAGENRMRKRMVVMLVAVAAFLTVIGGVKFRQIQAGMAMAASFQPPPEAVTTMKAPREEWPSALTAIGTVAAVRGVTVSADLPGVVESITFDSGVAVRQGQVLVRLDARQERAQLAAAESHLELTRLNLERARGLTEAGIVARADYDRARAEHAQAAARVGEIRATIDRKQVRAPFSGILGIRQVDLGQYLSAGDAIVALQAADPLYVDFAVPQQDVPRLRVGSAVEVGAEGLGETFAGHITALDSVVDAQTRNVQVQATIPNRKGRLRPGMFVETRVVLGATTSVIAIPASAISYAPYGDSVFVVAELEGPKGDKYRGARQQFVKLGASRGDQVAVLSGLEAGQEVVTSGAFKLRNGAAVRVSNDVPISNDAAPRPENN